MPADILDGIWYSGVGSTLELQVKGGILTGWFSSVEANPSKKAAVTGVVDPDDTRKDRALAFVISWIDESTKEKFRSISSYTGQFHRDEEVIHVTLLIVDETVLKRGYASTLVAHDTFTRLPLQ